MKLFVQPCLGCGRRIYIDIQARTRGDLRKHFGGEYFYLTCNNCNTRNIFSLSQVIAEAETNSAVTGGVVGGLLGLIGGPLGLLIGTGIGAAIGNSSDDDERSSVNFFNNSM